MKKSRFTETQIVSILNEADAGIKVQDICRKHGICPATFHRWKSKYGGMDTKIRSLIISDHGGAHLFRQDQGMTWSPSHGDTAFTVPIFDEFMHRIMPGDG